MNIGMLGMHGCYTSNRAVADCDVLIAVGTRFSDRVALNPKTCLLYTSRYSTPTRSKSSLLEILAYNTRALKV